jgi:hypothetical protein
MRYYHPPIGGFVSPEPRHSDQLAFRYTRNRPLVFADPTGLPSLDTMTGSLEAAILQGNIDQVIGIAQTLGYNALQIAAVTAAAALIWSQVQGAYRWAVEAGALRTGAVAGSLGTATSWCGQFTAGTAAYCSCLVAAYLPARNPVLAEAFSPQEQGPQSEH